MSEQLRWRTYTMPDTAFYAEGDTREDLAAFQVRYVAAQRVYRLRMNRGSGWYVVGAYSSYNEAQRVAQTAYDALASRSSAALNPIGRLTSGELTAVGVGLVAGIGAIVYYATRPATSAA